MVVDAPDVAALRLRRLNVHARGGANDGLVIESTRTVVAIVVVTSARDDGRGALNTVAFSHGGDDIAHRRAWGDIVLKARRQLGEDEEED